MALLKQKLKASTLIEVIISLLIITTLFFIFISFISQSSMSAKSFESAKAFLISEEVMTDLEKGKIQLKDSLNYKNYKIVTKIRPIHNNNMLYSLQVEVYAKRGKILVKREKIIESIKKKY